jgi:S1-C subfamily serine protease
MNSNDDMPPGGPQRPGDYSAPGLGEQAGQGEQPPPAGAGELQAGGETSQAPQPPSPQYQAPPQAQPEQMPSGHHYQGKHEAHPPMSPPIGASPPAAKRDKKPVGRGGLVFVALTAGVIGALLVLLVMPAIFGVSPYDLVRGKVKKVETTQQTTVNGNKQGTVSPAQGATDVSKVAAEVTPSVVNIDIRTTPQNTPFSLGQSETGTGSGVIYTADGYIITNNHVIADAQDIKVTLASGATLAAKKVGADPENDIAVIKIDKKGLPAIEVGNSDNLIVGQLVVAAGSPLGFEQTVTAGIVSALHRIVPVTGATGQTTVLSDLIQTDAPINPGNSGGALCDAGSRLIGINTLIASQSGGSEGIGFAIPVNTAKNVADSLIAGKPVSHPYIGILGQTISPSIAKQYNLPVEEGAYVTSVVPGSPAEKAGIKQGDIITAIDGKPVKSMDDVIGTVRGKQVGAKVSVTYYSGTSKKTVDLTLAEKPSTLPQQ